jgi:hypothetical protein
LSKVESELTGLKSALGICGVLILASATALAQPVGPPPGLTASEIHSEIKADVAQIKANAKASAVTRQQIQQLRTALKAKLAALHK